MIEDCESRNKRYVRPGSRLCESGNMAQARAVPGAALRIVADYRVTCRTYGGHHAGAAGGSGFALCTLATGYDGMDGADENRSRRRGRLEGV